LREQLVGTPNQPQFREQQGVLEKRFREIALVRTSQIYSAAFSTVSLPSCNSIMSP